MFHQKEVGRSQVVVEGMLQQEGPQFDMGQLGRGNIVDLVEVEVLFVKYIEENDVRIKISTCSICSCLWIC